MGINEVLDTVAVSETLSTPGLGPGMARPSARDVGVGYPTTLWR